MPETAAARTANSAPPPPDYKHTIGDAELRVTPAARARIKGLVQETGGEAIAVRIYVAGGGCSGMKYGMTFAEQTAPTDSVLADAEGFKLAIDPVAFAFLRGAEVDYVEDGVNTSFVFNNVFQAVGGSGACGGCGGGGF